MQYTGFGTQRLEEELAGRLPGARLLRLDADTTMSRFAHEEKFARFSRGDYDILLGTQMVAKGLDFPNVTLVGVISADQALFGDDYRSYERAFSLLTQVVGRSGRGSKKGRAIIQTFTPDHPVLALAARQDYEGFYKSEIAVRRGMLYPPFCDICMIGFVGPTEEKTESAARLFTELLRQQAEREFSNLPLRVLGPAPAPVSKVSGKYRYRLLIKCRDHPRLRELIRGLLTRLGRERGYDDVTVYADLNPEGML